MSEHCCPTCGGKLDDQFSWSLANRTFTTPTARVRFAENQAAIFDAIWNAGEAGIVSTERFMQAVYGGRVHGGPDNFNVISVTLIRMRKLMALSGYTITQNMGVPRQGWRIVKLPVVQQGEAAE
jgi:DNA-binding winged helix-turn-helix (wHTH) protein